MHMPGFWQMILLVAAGVILFGGGGKISAVMGDVAKGIKSFKKGMADEDETAKKPDQPVAIGKTIEANAQPVQSTETSKAS